MQFGDATGAFLMRHTALPRNGGAMQNAAGNPIRKKVPAFPALPKIYFPLILLALADIWDNLSRIFRDKGEYILRLDCETVIWYIEFTRGEIV